MKPLKNKAQYLLVISLLLMGAHAFSQNTFINAINVLDNGTVQIDFSLSPNTQSYSILRNSGGGFNSIYTGSNATDNSYTDNSINATLQSYTYYIEAQLSNGNTETTQQWSSTLLQTQDGNNGTAVLSWNLSYPPNSTYTVWRKPLNGTFTAIGTTTNNTYTDTIKACSAKLYYKISYQAGANPCKSNTAGQVFKNLTPPTTIIPINITLDSDNGNIVLAWEPPSATDNDIEKYQIWEMNDMNQSSSPTPIAEVFGVENTSAIIPSPHLCDSAIVLSVTAQDSCGNSSVWEPIYFLKALHLKPVIYDACTQECTLQWDTVPGWHQHPADGIRIFQQTNFQDFVQIADVSAQTTSYTIQNIPSNGYSHRFYIESYNTQLNQQSRSCTKTFIQAALDTLDAFWISPATIEQGKTHITWHTIGNAPTIKYFTLQVSDDDITYQDVCNINRDSTDYYHAIDHTTDYYLGPHYYRVLAIDTCDNILQTSAIAKTIFASCQYVSDNNSTESVKIQWTPYVHLDSIRYAVYQITSPNAMPELIAEVEDTTPLEWAIDISSDMIQMAGTEGIGFYVEAIGKHPQTPDIVDTVRSNTCFLSLPNKVVLPNAFNPRGVHNTTYKPLCFGVQIQDYHFVVFDQQQAIVFETRDPEESWDGYVDGELASSGSPFIAIVKITTKDNQIIEEQTVLIVL